MTDLLTWTVTQADMAAALAKDGTLTTVVTYAANDPKSQVMLLLHLLLKLMLLML